MENQMSFVPKGMLSVSDFAARANIEPDEVVVNLKSGRLAGRVIENDWYVEHVELRKADAEDAEGLNTVTSIMLAAANMNWREILNNIDERRRSPIKADTPEYGLNIPLIHKEAKTARARAIWFDLVIGIAALFGIGIWLGDTPDYYESSESGSLWFKLMLTLMVIASADLISRRIGLRRARIILKTLANAGPTQSVYSDHSRNVTISGGYSPFVGTGVDAGGWSFTVNLEEPEKSGMPVASTSVKDLYAETAASLNKLAIPAMQIKDEAFVDGRDVGGLPLLLPASRHYRPCNEIAPSDMEQLIGSNEYAVRHYKVIRLQLWEGQMILSVLFRYAIVSGTLYVEAKTLLLSPIAERFSKLQNMPILPTRKELLADAGWSLLRGTVIWIPVLLAGLNYIQGGFLNSERGWYKANRKEVDANQRYNYGWTSSLRETWAGTEYSRYFQMADNDFYSKMVKETLLDSLLKSLERRNISTASMKDATTKIYNEGIIVNGGTLKAESIAAGRGARATVKRALRAATGRGPKA
jgi:hypothetical protein